jgi:hypothetical protein
MKESVKKIFAFIEDAFLKYLWFISVILSILSSIGYMKGYINNIRTTMSNVITFAFIIIVVISLILTLLTSLKESMLFIRIKKMFPIVNKSIYIFLNKIITSAIMIVLICIGITILQNGLNTNIKVLISLIGFSLFYYMILGASYMLKYTIDMIVKDDTTKKPDKLV